MPARGAGIRRLGQEESPGLGAALHLRNHCEEGPITLKRCVLPWPPRVPLLFLLLPAGISAHSEKPQNLYNSVVAQKRTNQSAALCDVVRTPEKQQRNFFNPPPPLHHHHHTHAYKHARARTHATATLPSRAPACEMPKLEIRNLELLGIKATGNNLINRQPGLH